MDNPLAVNMTSPDGGDQKGANSPRSPLYPIVAVNSARFPSIIHQLSYLYLMTRIAML